MYYVMFDCSINGPTVDLCIRQPPLDLSFCLPLPQTSCIANPSPSTTSTAASTDVDKPTTQNPSISTSLLDIINDTTISPNSLRTKIASVQNQAKAIEDATAINPKAPPSDVHDTLKF